jgi:hypothetical protein
VAAKTMVDVLTKLMMVVVKLLVNVKGVIVKMD